MSVLPRCILSVSPVLPVVFSHKESSISVLLINILILSAPPISLPAQRRRQLKKLGHPISYSAHKVVSVCPNCIQQ